MLCSMYEFILIKRKTINFGKLLFTIRATQTKQHKCICRNTNPFIRWRRKTVKNIFEKYLHARYNNSLETHDLKLLRNAIVFICTTYLYPLVIHIVKRGKQLWFFFQHNFFFNFLFTMRITDNCVFSHPNKCTQSDKLKRSNTQKLFWNVVCNSHYWRIVIREWVNILKPYSTLRTYSIHFSFWSTFVIRKILCWFSI